MSSGANGAGHNRPPRPKRDEPAPEAGRSAPQGGGETPTGLPPRPPAGLLDLRPDGPFRPPDYRWQLAARLAAGERVPKKWVDRWVRRAKQVLAARPGRAVKAPDLRAIEAARELAERGTYWQKVEVEARLLAAESAAAIAAKTGLTAAAVEAYAELFYAVADRLKHPGYIIHQVIRLHSPGAETDIGTHVRVYGLYGGPLVLDVTLAAVARPGGDAGADGAGGHGRLHQRVRLSLGLRTTPWTQKNAMRWMRLYALMRECEMRGVRSE